MPSSGYDRYDYARPPYIDHPRTSTVRSALEGLTDPIRTIAYLDFGMGNHTCLEYKFSPEEVQSKFLSILPYLATDDISKSMLHNLSSTLKAMSQDRSKNVRDTSFLASVLLPVIFMSGTKDTWCFVDRFHRALVQYTVSEYDQRENSFKVLDGTKLTQAKARILVTELGNLKPTRTPPSFERETDLIDALRKSRHV